MTSPFFAVIADEDARWAGLVARCAHPSARLLACSGSSPNRRLYEHRELTYKISVAHDPAYRNTLAQEYELLRAVAETGVAAEPVSMRDLGDCQVLCLKAVHGDQVGQFGDRPSRSLLSLRAVARGFLALNRLGVMHGDVHLGNLFFMPDRSLRIVDFDQARLTSPLGAMLGDWFGLSAAGAHRTVARLLAQIVASRMPRRLRAWTDIGRRVRARRGPPPPSPPPNTGIERALADIWNRAALANASAPGRPVAYYSLRFGGMILPGERAWEPRWDSIRRHVDFRGQRLLELGCNMGLLSCYARQAGAEAGGWGIDHDPQIVEVARAFAEIAQTGVTYHRMDFDDPAPWEDTIPVERFSLVSALSVMNWLRNQGRFLRFLGRFPALLYEGHDSMAVELGRLRSAGFTDFQLLTVADRGRPTILARRDPGAD